MRLGWMMLQSEWVGCSGIEFNLNVVVILIYTVDGQVLGRLLCWASCISNCTSSFGKFGRCEALVGKTMRNSTIQTFDIQLCVYCNICKYKNNKYIFLFTLVHAFMYVSVKQFHLPDWMVTNYNPEPTVYPNDMFFMLPPLVEINKFPPVGHNPATSRGRPGETPHPP